MSLYSGVGLIALLFLVNSVAGGCAYATGCNAVVAAYAARVEAEANAASRQRVAHEILYYIKDHQECANPAVANSLVPLLSDRDDLVVGFAANALALIGPPAKTAVPALNAALARADTKAREQLRTGQIFYDRTLSEDIRYALQQTTGHRPSERDLEAQ